MNSSPLKNTSKLLENGCFNENITDMSPVTDLALNLKSLKTTFTATPTRRISWSDPFKNAGTVKCSDLSPSTDSPMFQEILTKNAKRCKRIASRKMLSLALCDEKENMPPESEMQFDDSESDNLDINDSQDSGYCEASEKKNKFNSTTSGSTPRLKVRSSLFADNSISLEGIFSLDCSTGVNSTSMEGLLTKPLCNIEKSKDVRNNQKRKSSTRRCLNMEMECNRDSSFMQMDFYEDSMDFSSVIAQNDCESTNLELLRLPFKRPDPSDILELQNKRRKSSPSVNLDIEYKVDFTKPRSFSETAATIMLAVQKADLQPDLIGDCSRCYALPLVKGRHQDLKCISSETLVQVLRGDYVQQINEYTLIDCRYPYEFEGGHIVGAQNIYTKEEIIQKFLQNGQGSNNKNIIIFHCEFSSERAPNLCRFLRNKDRELNECNYPKLFHPEMYLLEGGYKAFFAKFQEYCEPQNYTPMNHKDHSSDLRVFRAKSKSWGSDAKVKYKMKSGKEMTNI